jgi:hypothetical protein
MSLSTYAGLQAAAADYLNRADLTTPIVDFITLAEAKFNRKLRVPAMITRVTATPTAEFDSLPSDFLQMYKLERTYSSEMAELEYVPPQEASAMVANGITSTLRYYTIIGNSLQVIPAASSSSTDVLKLAYYAKIPALTTSNTTNWLLTKSPDLYLYSTLLEAAPYLKNDERIATWGAVQQGLIEDIMLEGERAMRPTTQLRSRVRTFG